MSFVGLGGDGLRPTFFELVAAERLMPSLRAALLYSLSVAAQRRPRLAALLEREDELFFLVSVLLDKQALGASGGSFAEGLYGLRRAPVAPGGGKGGGDAGGGAAPALPLSAQERQTSLVLLVSGPCLCSVARVLLAGKPGNMQGRQPSGATSPCLAANPPPAHLTPPSSPPHRRWSPLCVPAWTPSTTDCTQRSSGSTSSPRLPRGTAPPAAAAPLQPPWSAGAHRAAPRRRAPLWRRIPGCLRRTRGRGLPTSCCTCWGARPTSPRAWTSWGCRLCG